MPTLCETVELVCSTLSKITHSLITTVSKTGVKRYYYPTEDTNTARVASLVLALKEITDYSEVILEGGTYVLDTKLSVISPNKLYKFKFTNSAALWYTDERLADDSDFAYQGNKRYGADHGIYPGLGPNVDMQPRIQAALFSMLLIGEPVVYIPDYPGGEVKNRIGELYLDWGFFHISKTIYYTGFQSVLGYTGWRTNLSQTPTFAPAGGPEKFMLQMAPWAGPGYPQGMANASYSCRITDIMFVNDYPANKMGSGLLHGGAQGSLIDNIWTLGLGSRGIVFHPHCMYFTLGHLYLDGHYTVVDGTANTNYMTGPLLDIQNCQNFVLDLAILQFFNKDKDNRKTKTTQTAAGPYTHVTPCCYIRYCHGFKIHSMGGETNASVLGIYESTGFNIGAVSAAQANEVGLGETMVRIVECEGWMADGMNSMNYDRFFEVYNGGALLSYANSIRLGDNVSDRCEPSGRSLHLSESIGSRSSYLHDILSTTSDAKLWSWRVGGDFSGRVLILESADAAGGNACQHMYFKSPLGTPGAYFPPGFTIIMDYQAKGGVAIGKLLNVGFNNPTPATSQFQINGVKVLGPQQPAIANGADPTVNAILAALRAHGLIAP